MSYVQQLSTNIIIRYRYNLNLYLPNEMSVPLIARRLKCALKGGGGELSLGYHSTDGTTTSFHYMPCEFRICSNFTVECEFTTTVIHNIIF